MRSELIFRAQERVANKFKLCQTAAKVTRCLHYYSTTTQDAISDALVRIAHVQCMAQQIGEEEPLTMLATDSSLSEREAQEAVASH